MLKMDKAKALEIYNKGCKNYEAIENFKEQEYINDFDLAYIYSICSYNIKGLQSIPLQCVKEKVKSYKLISDFRNLYISCHYKNEKR